MSIAWGEKAMILLPKINVDFRKAAVCAFVF
jgi:hypothetical protein